MRKAACIFAGCLLLLPAHALAQATSTDTAWRELVTRAPTLVKNVQTTLLPGKHLNRASLVLSGHRYRAQLDRSKSYGQTLARFYFSRVLKAGTMAVTFETVRDLAKAADEFRVKNRPLMADAERMEKLTATLREALAKHVKLDNPGAFTGTGIDELSVSLKHLSEAIAAGNVAETRRWSAEAEGAAMRLADLLRWVDLQCEWTHDLAWILERFASCVERSDRGVAAAGGWKNFMFGRLPGCSSLMEVTLGDALTCETMLADFLVVSDVERTVMGKTDASERCFAVTPEERSTFVRMRDALSGKAKDVFAAIPLEPYERTALNSNLARYVREKKTAELTASLRAYAKHHAKPEVRSMMEVVHIAQGAFGSTTSAGDRYHDEMVAWSGKLSGKPDKAAARAHALAHGFYTQGGRRHYRGRLWTIHDAQKAKATDCIRASQMMGSAYANAGYTGLHPVRICRGNLKQKIIGTSGHTFVCVQVGRKNVCLDALMKRTFLKSFEKIHAGDRTVVSVAKGYRTLDSFVSGQFRFPQGPVRGVQLRVPYYHLKRKGFQEDQP